MFTSQVAPKLLFKVPKCLDRDRIFAAQHTKNQSEIQAELDRYQFFHRIHVFGGIYTRGVPWSDDYTSRFQSIVDHFDFTGKRVLDVGASDGAMSLMAERAGAKDVVAMDNNASAALVNFVIPFFNSHILPVEDSVYNLSPDVYGTFDVVFMGSLMYHLVMPFNALACVRCVMKVGARLIIETACLVEFEDLPVLLCTPGDTSPYEPTSPMFFNVSVISAALHIHGFKDVKVEDRFGRVEFDAAQHFPKFSKLIPTLNKLSIERVILSCTAC